MRDDKLEEPFDEMVRVLAKVTDVDLIKRFLESLLTENEVKEITARWALVRLIEEGKSQRRIANDLGLSLCKITRGSKELKKENSAFQQMVELYKQLETG